MADIFRDGTVHVMAEMCPTCIFRPGNLMHLAPGRLTEMIRGATEADSTIICHSTLDGPNAACRGFFDRHATQPLQVAHRLGLVTWQERETMDPAEFDHIFRTPFGIPPSKADLPLCGASLPDSWDWQGPRPPCPDCAALVPAQTGT